MRLFRCGHPRTPENTREVITAWQRKVCCRQCRLDYARAYNHRVRGAPKQPCRRFTAEEDAFLLNAIAKDIPYRTIAEKLGRPRTSVKTRHEKLLGTRGHA